MTISESATSATTLQPLEGPGGQAVPLAARDNAVGSSYELPDDAESEADPATVEAAIHHSVAPPKEPRRRSRARLPSPRGPLSEFLLASFRKPTHNLRSVPSCTGHPIWGEDAGLALYLCYELHYRGLAGVSDEWEWEPSVLALRRSLEDSYLRALYHEVGAPAPCGEIGPYLHHVLASGTAPSLSAYMATNGTLEQFREFAVHRSAYQLKEADPHSWAIPRLDGPAKAALVTIQFDEYGNGREAAMHASLFADTLSALGLDPTYGAYLDYIPGVTLATVNLISLFGLHRRWRGALIGHLSIFEMASVGPNTRYAAALRRLGLGVSATGFYDVHVIADASHEVIAVDQMASGLAQADPELAADIAFGARAIMLVEERFSRHLLAAWESDASSLRARLGP